MKKSFILYYDSLDVIDAMTDEQGGKLLKKMRSYHNGNSYKSNDPLVDVVFVQFKNQFDRDLDKYDNVCKRNKEIAVRRREKQRSTKSTSGKSGVPKSTRSTHNDSDSDKHTDNDNVKDNDKEKNKSLSKDKEATPKVDKRNQEALLIIENIKKSCLGYGVIYQPDPKDYQYAKYMVGPKFKRECLDIVNMDMEKFIDSIIMVSSSTRYSKVCNNPKSIYYNWADVINKYKQEREIKKDKEGQKKNLVSRINL